MPKCECGCKESIHAEGRHVDFTRPPKDNTEKMREYNRRYREKNSDMMTCPCGAVFKRISNYTHLNSKSHQAWATIHGQN